MNKYHLEYCSLPSSAIEVLILLLQDNNTRMRHRATDVPRRQTTLLSSVIEALIPLLQDEDADVRDLAADVLEGQTTLPSSSGLARSQHNLDLFICGNDGRIYTS